MKEKVKRCIVCGTNVLTLPERRRFVVKCYDKQLINVMGEKSYHKNKEFKYVFCFECYVKFMETAINNAIIEGSVIKAAERIPEEKLPACNSDSCPKLIGKIQDCRDCEKMCAVY